MQQLNSITPSIEGPLSGLMMLNLVNQVLFDEVSLEIYDWIYDLRLIEFSTSFFAMKFDF